MVYVAWKARNSQWFRLQFHSLEQALDILLQPWFETSCLVVLN